MSKSNNNVLVFGAAGGVGSAAAKSASQHGAKVWLAMRDTNKPIPGLSASDEKALGFNRIQADISSTSSLTEAVAKSGATSAFVYTIHEGDDSMRSTFDALKRAGISYIVILSSSSVRSLQNTEDLLFIPNFHAETERQLQESGIKYAALRPAYFNTNILRHANEIKDGCVQSFLPESRNDYLAPEDIGDVAGALLTEPKFREPETDKNGKVIYLCGPKMMSQREALAVVSSVLGHEIQIDEISEEQFTKNISFFPQPVITNLVHSMRANASPNGEYTIYEEGIANLRKYLKREPTTFVDWVKANKEAFA